MENSLTTKDLLPQTETWRPVRDYVGFYMVSSFGLVRSVTRRVMRSRGGTQILRGRILKPCLVKGYKTVVLSKEGITKRFYVHDLVAQSYFPKPKGLVIDHINNNPLDNRVSNLRYCTQRENMNNRSIVSETGFVGVSLNGKYYKKKFRARISIDGKLKDLGSYHTAKEAGGAYQKAKNKLK